MSKRVQFYAVFTKFDQSIEVIFPDIEGCYAYGFDLADAYRMAFDELSTYLPKLDLSHSRPSSYEEIKMRYAADNQIILPFPVTLNDTQSRSQ